jgi:hypothetical protein
MMMITMMSIEPPPPPLLLPPLALAPPVGADTGAIVVAMHTVSDVRVGDALCSRPDGQVDTGMHARGAMLPEVLRYVWPSTHGTQTRSLEVVGATVCIDPAPHGAATLMQKLPEVLYV